MSRRASRAWLLITALLCMAALPGCALGTTMHTTQITVQVSGEELLHVAVVPRFLPDGSRTTQQAKALLEDVARRAGGYTCVENVMGGWMPPDAADLVEEQSDLLLVKGPPGVAPFLRLRLHQDFGQQYPFVVSLPVQSIAVVRVAEPPERAAEAEPAE